MHCDLELAGQRISETFAHLYPVVLNDIEDFLTERKKEIFDVAREKGRLQVFQQALVYYKSKLCITRYIYEEIQALLRQATVPVGDRG